MILFNWCTCMRPISTCSVAIRAALLPLSWTLEKLARQWWLNQTDERPTCSLIGAIMCHDRHKVGGIVPICHKFIFGSSQLTGLTKNEFTVYRSVNLKTKDLDVTFIEWLKYSTRHLRIWNMGLQPLTVRLNWAKTKRLVKFPVSEMKSVLCLYNILFYYQATKYKSPLQQWKHFYWEI